MLGLIDWRVLRRIATDYPRTTAAVVLVNVFPLGGVLFGGWSAGLLLTLYWLETGILLVFALAAGLFAAQPGDTSNDNLPLHRLVNSDRSFHLRSDGPTVYVRNVPVVLSSAILFGIFWVGHGVFVRFFATVIGGGGLTIDHWFALALVGVVCGQASEFYSEQFVDRHDRTANAKTQSFSIAQRTIILHLTLLLGGFVIVVAALIFPPASVLVLVLLIAFKMPYELVSNARVREVSSEDGAP